MKLMTWNSVRRGMILIALAATASLSAIAMAQDAGLSKRIDLFLQDADLLRATQMLTRETGVQFAIAPSDKEFDKINLSLKGVTAEDAIRYICEAAGAYAERDENGVFIIRRGPKPNPNQGVGGTTVQKPRKIERIKITKADPKYVYDMLTKGVVFDPDYGFREMNRFSQEFQQASLKPGAQVVMVGGAMVNPGYSYPVAGNSGNPLPDDTSKPLGDGGGNGVFLPGETANQFGGGGGRQGGGGGGGNQGGGGGIGGGQGQGGGALQSGTGFTPDGITRVTYDPTTNSLIVEGDDEAIRKLRTIVNLFDVAPKQVIIKVEFVTTSQSVTKSLGMDWLYQRGAISAGNRPGTFARTGDPIFINYATGNITTRLRTQLTDSGGKTVNAPLIRTLNNQTATVFQNNQTTVFINQTTVSNGTIVQTSNPQQLTIQTGLTVRPRINDDGYVTMTLTPTISDFGQLKRSADGQEIPDILTQSIAVVARVKSGDTIALGGLTRKQTNTSVSRFPILADLPLIGNLFRTSNSQRNDSELIIFVTPIIVEDDTAGGFTP